MQYKIDFMIKTYTTKSQELVKVGNVTIAKRIVVDQFGTERLVHVDIKSQIVIILAITSDDKIVCIRQFRFGPSQVSTELPAGKVDEGEDGLSAAKRELLEETGFTGDLEFVASTIAAPNNTSVRHTFVCKNAVKIQDPTPTIYESQETVLMDLSEFRAKIKLGEIFPTESCYLGLDRLEKL
jgi:ADP-ribose pyrophosphatase